MTSKKSSPHHGVTWKHNKSWKRGKWRVQIRHGDRRQKHIGYYLDEEYAARIYNGVAKEIQGGDAVLNLDGEIPADMCRVDILALLKKRGLR